ncbi:MAG: sialidase family protein, partial [Thermomicrobiales bacterium]
MRFRLGCALLATALVLCVAPAVTAGSSAAIDPTRPAVVVAARGERNTYFPTIARLRDGVLVVVYYDSPAHTSQSGRIALVRSTDDGRTWSAPRVVLDTPLDDRDPQIMQTRTGALLLSFFTYDWEQTPAKVIGSYVARSEDNGATWSAPTPVGTALAWTATSAKIIELDDGRLLIPLYGAMPGSSAQRATAVVSADDGRTWPASSEVTIAADPAVDFQEPALVALGGGKLLAVIRTARAGNLAYTTDSADGGRTWTPPSKTDMQAQAPDLLALPGGVVLLTWGDVSGAFAPGRPVVGRLKYPGQVWSAAAPVLLYAGTQKCGDESYPSSVLLADGRTFTVYYDACAGYIGGTYSTLADYP